MRGWGILLAVVVGLSGCRSSKSGPEPVPAPDATFAWGRGPAAPPSAPSAPSAPDAASEAPAPKDAAAEPGPEAAAPAAAEDGGSSESGEEAAAEETDAASEPDGGEVEEPGDGGETDAAGEGEDAEVAGEGGTEEAGPGDDATAEEAAAEVAAATGEFRWPHTRWIHGIWSDGVDRVFVADGTDGLFECRRGADPELVPAIPGVTMLAGSGAGAESVLVAVSALRVGRYAGGEWEFVGPPGKCTFFDRPVGLAVDGSGTAYLALRYGDLHVWRDDRWATVRYPDDVRKSCDLEPDAVSDEPEIVDAIVLGDGTVYVLGSPGLLYVLEGEALAEPAFAEAARAALTRGASFTSIAVGSGTGELWIGTNRKLLLQVDRESGRVTVHTVNLFGGMRELLVLPGDEPALFIAAQTDVGVLRGRTFRKLPGRVVFADALVLEPGGEAVLAASRDGILSFGRDLW